MYETYSDGTVTIRPYEPGDAEHVYKAVRESGPDLSYWMPEMRPELSVAEVSSMINETPHLWAEGTAYHFAVVSVEDGALLGGCGLTHVRRGHRYVNLYYWVRGNCTGRGIATAAARLAARFAFEHLALHRVEIVVAVGNEASAKVAEKAGALYEGTLRNRLYLHEKSYDAMLYSLVPSDLGL
jgi:RimJ/RimL family protein N-acetyltransferase